MRSWLLASCVDAASDTLDTMTDNETEGDYTGNATFAGGCFWCMEGAFEAEPGVKEAISGYAGGSQDTATYEQVCTGDTNHREAVRIIYDPERVSYERLLEIFWRQIDPTDPDGQFADRGPHYTTAIYYHDEDQREAAEASKRALDASGRFDELIVTAIEPYTTFFRAEREHQDFYKKRTDHYKTYEAFSGRKGFKETAWD